MLGKRRLYRLRLCGLALALGLQSGCLQFFHPIDPLPKEEVQQHIDLPDACKNGVYVFLLHGIDPFDLANLEGLNEYIRSLGFIKTYFGQPFHVFHYEREIRAIRKRDPNARFVLVGFSYGAGLVRDLACTLKKHSIEVDLLVYIDRVTLSDRPLLKPSNVLKVVNILTASRTDEYNIIGAENFHYDDTWHFGTVTNPLTLHMFVQELGEIARRVPVITHLPSAPSPDGVLPAPNPAPAMLPPPTPNAKRGEWDFLKPDGHANGMPGRKPTFEAINMPPAKAETK